MSNPIGASFGPDGIPVYLVSEWAPGVEVVQEVSGDYSVAHYTPVAEYSSGVRAVMLAGGAMLEADRAQQAVQHAALAYAASLSHSGSSGTHTSSAAAGVAAAAHLLLLS